MGMYTQREAAVPQKFFVLTIELLLVALSAWILFGSGRVVVASLFGWRVPPEIPLRAFLIFAFSIVILARMSLTLFYLMKRRVSWAEVATAPTAFALYYVGFAVLALPQTAPLGGWDYLAVALFIVGCFLNTGSELARDRFKKNPANKGKLYVNGLFSLSRHINFFGDILWVSAYAIVAHTAWAAIIPIYTLSFFGFFNAPALDRYLADHYGEQYTAYAERTKMLIPFVW